MYLIGDIGNTDIKICLFNRNMKLIKKKRLKTILLNKNYLSKNLKFIKRYKSEIKKVLVALLYQQLIIILKNLLNDRQKLNVLNKWAEFIYSPLMKDKVQKIQESDSGIYGAKIASEVHKELKKLGGVKPPKEFVFMDRAAVGLGSVFLHLKAELNWYRIFNELIEGFNEKKMNLKQKKILNTVNL